MTHFERVSSCILKQTDPALPAAVNRYGCRLMCLIAIPQFVAGVCLTAEQIAEIIRQGRKEEGVITNELMRTGGQEHRLINMAFAALGKAAHGRQTGWNERHFNEREWSYCIKHFRTDGPDGHFVLYDKTNTAIYDPHDAEQAGYEINMIEVLGWRLYNTWSV